MQASWNIESWSHLLKDLQTLASFITSKQTTQSLGLVNSIRLSYWMIKLWDSASSLILSLFVYIERKSIFWVYFECRLIRLASKLTTAALSVTFPLSALTTMSYTFLYFLKCDILSSSFSLNKTTWLNLQSFLAAPYNFPLYYLLFLKAPKSYSFTLWVLAWILCPSLLAI